jgi:hypothetical protein
VVGVTDPYGRILGDTRTGELQRLSWEKRIPEVRRVLERLAFKTRFIQAQF